LKLPQVIGSKARFYSPAVDFPPVILHNHTQPAMKLLVTAARWEAIFLIAAFAVITLRKVLETADLSTLLRDTDGSFSPGRVQMLVLTVLTAMQYLLTTLHDPTHLPSIPSNLVATLGGSHAVYLGAKAWSKFGPTGRKQ